MDLLAVLVLKTENVDINRPSYININIDLNEEMKNKLPPAKKKVSNKRNTL